MAQIRWEKHFGSGQNTFLLFVSSSGETALDLFPASDGNATTRRIVRWEHVSDALIALFGDLQDRRVKPSDTLFFKLSNRANSPKHVQSVLAAVAEYVQHATWPRMTIAITPADTLSPIARQQLTRWMYPPTPRPIAVDDPDMLDDAVSIALAAEHPGAATQTDMAAYCAEHKLSGFPVRYSRLVINGIGTTRVPRPAQQYRDTRDVWLDGVVLAEGALRARLHEQLLNRVERRAVAPPPCVRSVGNEFPGAHVMPTAWTIYDEHVVILTILSGDDNISDTLNVHRTLAMYNNAGVQFVWASRGEQPSYLSNILGNYMPVRFFRLPATGGSIAQVDHATQFLGRDGTAPETVLDWAAYFAPRADLMLVPELRPDWDPADAHASAQARADAFKRERLARHILYGQVMYKGDDAGPVFRTIPLNLATDFHNVLAGAFTERLVRLVRRAGLVAHLADAAELVAHTKLRWSMEQRMKLWETYAKKYTKSPPLYQDVNIFPLFNKFYGASARTPPPRLPEFDALDTPRFVFVRYSTASLEALLQSAADTLANPFMITHNVRDRDTPSELTFLKIVKRPVQGREIWYIHTSSEWFFMQGVQLSHGSAISVAAESECRVFALEIVDQILHQIEPLRR